MENVLVLAHPDAAGALPKAALEALSAARVLAAGGQVTAAVFGADPSAAAAALAATGVAKVRVARDPALAQPRYATDAAAAAALVKASGATVVVVPATSRLARVAAGVAARVGGKVDSHVAAVTPEGAITRWTYRQRIEATLKRTDRPWFLLVDPGAFPAAAPAGGAAPVEDVAVALPAARTTVEGERAPASGEQTIKPDAKLLFVAGAGWTKKQADGQLHAEEAEGLVKGFLAASGASLGSSKSLVDQAGEGHKVFGFMTHLNQIGQTGATPRHAKGLSTCCHGEEPHVVGWRFIRERRAVSLDANCGWARGKADVVYVADAFQVIAKLNALLGASSR
ncbi:MAG: electron transfer flavoprotein subunit alpha [Anaeromyxobacter sp.]